MKWDVILIGYSGHAFVAYEIFELNGIKVSGYCDLEEKKNNPYGLEYLGDGNREKLMKIVTHSDYFVAIGENKVRKKIMTEMESWGSEMINAIHPGSIVSSSVSIGKGVMIAPHVVINAQTKIHDGVIVNSGAIVEHECRLGRFTHIAPGAVLCGNVQVGECTFIGANTVIKQGIRIGSNVTIGAGSVILKDIPDYSRVAGNPLKNI